MVGNCNELISVIVPVYNAEAYLEKCIRSIIEQKYGNLEIILVDDGSKDSSLIICQKYASVDKRIHIVHQENGGVASARNRGLHEATGVFITWVDSDDSIQPDYIQQLYDVIQKYDADIAIASKQYKGNENCIRNKEKILQKYLMGNLTSYLWSTLIKRELYSHLTFKPLKIGEDALMLCQVYCKAEGLVIFCSDGYCYTERIDSASSNRSFENLKMWLGGVKEQELIVEKECSACLPFMNYKETLYALSFLIWTKELNEDDITLFRKELWNMFHKSVKRLPLFHISLRQYKNLIKLYLEAKTIR